MDADIGVVGVGTMGAMTCWQLARRGASVIGFEQFGPGHDQSGAGGESRLFRTAYLEGPRYVPLLLEAQRQWRALESETGRRLLTLNGGLMIGDPDGEFLRAVMGCVREYDLPHEVLDGPAAARRFPQHPLDPGEAMVLDHQAGFVRPELSVAWAAHRAEEFGTRIRRHDPVRAVEPDTDGVTVVTATRRWRVGRVVLAAGAWSHRLCPELAPELDLQRLVMTWFPARHADRFTVERFPIFVRQSRGHDISGWPTLDGGSVKVAVNYGYDQVADPDRLDRTVADGLLGTIRAAVADLLPDLLPEPVRVGAYLDGYTADHHALVGAAPGVPNTMLACGFSGHGFKLSPAIGRAVAELLCDGATDLPIAHLDPGRRPGAVGDRPRRTVRADLDRGPSAVAPGAPGARS